MKVALPVSLLMSHATCIVFQGRSVKHVNANRLVVVTIQGSRVATRVRDVLIYLRQGHVVVRRLKIVSVLRVVQVLLEADTHFDSAISFVLLSFLNHHHPALLALRCTLLPLPHDITLQSNRHQGNPARVPTFINQDTTAVLEWRAINNE